MVSDILLQKMFKVLFFFACFILINAQDVLVTPRVVYDENSIPTPYEFSYTAPAEGGSSSHQQSGDGYGRVTGSYTIEDDDGRQRIVDYVADEAGFRASVSTNEPGTANQNPADVTIASSADDGYEGTQSVQTTPAVVTPVAPESPVVPAAVPPPLPPPLPVRRQQLVPVQPTLVPLQPTLVPVQPQFVEPRRFIVPPSLFPLDAGRFAPRAVVPFDTRRYIDPPTLLPVGNTRYIPDPFFSRLDRDFYL